MNYQLADVCRDWLSKNAPVPSFAEVIRVAIQTGAQPDEISDEFGTMRSTPRRWADETTRPRPRLQEQVVRWLRQIAWGDRP